MRLIDPLMMEFDREASTTRKLIERLPDGRLSYRPHPRSRTAGELAWHLAGVPAWVASGLLASGQDLASTERTPPPPATTAAIVEAFAANCYSAKGAMNQLDDLRAMEPWTLSMGSRTIVEMPRIAFLRNILLNHSVHHRGQLSVYLRLLDIPVPSIYGPSADESPFA